MQGALCDAFSQIVASSPEVCVPADTAASPVGLGSQLCRLPHRPPEWKGIGAGWGKVPAWHLETEAPLQPHLLPGDLGQAHPFLHSFSTS